MDDQSTHLLIDHQIFSLQSSYGGISRYFANIISQSEAQKHLRVSLGVLYSTNYYLQSLLTPRQKTVGKMLLKKQRKIYKWNQKYSVHLLKKESYNIFHPTYYDPYFIPYCKSGFILTVHDMIHERYPAFFDRTDPTAAHKRQCIEEASHIIAISDTTKKDLIDILGVQPDCISVIHHGYKSLSESTHSEPDRFREYLLFVGDRGGYKNFIAFVTAVAPILSETQDLHLVCAGGGELQTAEIELLRRLKISNKVIQINAHDGELRGLYENALCFVFPSLYEGFGFPILEAFDCNCPVLASDTPCFREIGEGAVRYFDPTCPQSIYSEVKAALYNSSLRANLNAAGAIQLEKFSIAESLEKTIDVYKKFQK
ncbi:glycosyltransferase family 4 protein [Pedobacter deserti]|uniref:glycosyltransferase family 4 protein n=1 Tax=Pedobacter deserti TaxID=2817382 RepID=UPI00210CA67C|nr:glycosyltransferase family 1 protein [Pedobacter sp. SYSU D00382]